MSLNRYAKTRDDNESDIVDALRAAGCSVVRLDRPCDLVVGRAHRNYLMEIKLPLGPQGGDPSRMTDGQEEFERTWRGQFAVVRTIREAFTVVGLRHPN